MILSGLYNKRWGIETSFREVKYALGLNALHSKKRKLI
ncbi:transposase, partial [Thomasclavelia cocleata]